MNDEPKPVAVYKDAPAQSFDQALANLLLNQDALSTEKMELIMRARRELLTERARESFQISFAEMSKEMPQVTRDGMIDLREKGKMRYARIEDMDTVIRPILSAHGFSLMFQEYLNDNGAPMMRGKLMHVDGHFEVSERPIRQDPGPGRNSEQAWGSGTTYARRYLMEGLCNIIRRNVDDDAVNTDEKLSEQEGDALHELLIATLPEGRNIGEYTSRFLHAMVTGVEKIADLPKRDYARLKNALEDRKKAQERK